MSRGGATRGHLETPTLDREAAGLLRDISEHGGYAYAAMSGPAAAGDVRAAEAAREMAWEQLHSGPWHSVLPVWRDAYSMACLHVARLHYRGGELKEALRVLDLGLIMGGTLLRKDLEAAVERLSVEARDARFLGGQECEEEGLDKRLVREGIDLDKVLRILPIKSLSLKTVARRSALSLEGFLREFFLSDCPVVITDCMSQWPARTKWNDMDYLKTIAGDRTVPVEVGKNYLCSEWKQELITFSQFLERLQSNDPSAADPTYLAQHPLFDQINELRKDILIPDYCFAGGGELKSLNAWFGPAGTVTPLHHDPHHNILAQVVGAKYIRLYSSSFSEELYPHSETMLCNSSKVDLDDIDEKEYPKFMGLEFMDCILEEGEMLYIPPKWWHYVRSLTTSFSVSFWWSKPESSSDS
ncbi:lysine-specific demethylase JMJ30 isoform X1 [Rhodamnia argentea]|uniref:Lysine-specific demethylase JMJ30 isoform X1 n=1 Tax=Rhodamnia argentea TaxID=178133 RepID=A0A8B8NY49_9MYRT|nr:lysine-specific demethylase JMJ30 isoform X1 [Rhodamnia argentea]